MLTEAEKKWLEERAVESCETCREPDELFCSLCSRDPRPKSLSADFFSMSGCAMTTNWQDAAEFEARVALSLTSDMPYAFGFCQLCKYNSHGCRKLRMPLRQCILKHARLAVEAEMEQ